MEEDHEDHSYKKSSEHTESGLREEYMEEDQEESSQAVVDRTDIAAEVEVLIKRRDRRLLSQLITFPERQLRLRPVEELFQGWNNGGLFSVQFFDKWPVTNKPIQSVCQFINIFITMTSHRNL